MPDLTGHGPSGLCTCEPDGEDICEYRMIADLVIGRLNPPDSDWAEVSLVMETIERLATFTEGLPCTCPPDAGPPDYGEPCGRCAALGRRLNVWEQR